MIHAKLLLAVALGLMVMSFICIHMVKKRRRRQQQQQ